MARLCQCSERSRDRAICAWAPQPPILGLAEHGVSERIDVGPIDRLDAPDEVHD